MYSARELAENLPVLEGWNWPLFLIGLEALM